MFSIYSSEQTSSKIQSSTSLDRVTDRYTVKKQCEDTHPDRWIPSERFWDTLPRIFLTRRALAEHGRRNYHQHSKLQAAEAATPPLRRSTRLRQLTCRKHLQTSYCAGDREPEPEPELRRFARDGGPDLTSIRGYPDPTMSDRISRSTEPAKNPGRTTLGRRSNLYDANYEMKLAQAGVFLTEEIDEKDDYIMPANHEEIMARLNETRPSLSPSRFSERDFQKFRQQAQRASTETSTMQHVMSKIEGQQSSPFYCLNDVPFNNLKPFDPEMAVAKPDQYDGAQLHAVHHRVFKDLSEYIVPSTNLNRPTAPNFFIEGKSRMGRSDVAQRQAAHNGAIGARGMMKLQSYPSRVPQYDSNAYSFTNTYHDGTLKMYTTHATAPRAFADQPSYHMTQVGAFAMTHDSETFRKGAAYYRNARDLAKEQRDSLIQQANQAARQLPTSKHGSRSRTTTNKGSRGAQ